MKSIYVRSSVVAILLVLLLAASLLPPGHPVQASGSPDIFVKKFTSSVSGSDVFYSATICGGAATGAFTLKFWFNRASAPTCSTTDPGAWVALEGLGLPANTCITLTGTIPGFPSGAYTSWLFVDAGCQITESDETNNVKPTAFTIGMVHDIKIVRLRAPGRVGKGDTLPVSADVKNEGTVAETFDVRLKVDDVVKDTKSVTALAPGASTTVEFDFDTSPEILADHTITVETETVAGETDVADNVNSVNVTVVIPERAITGIVWKDLNGDGIRDASEEINTSNPDPTTLSSVSVTIESPSISLLLSHSLLVESLATFTMTGLPAASDYRVKFAEQSYDGVQGMFGFTLQDQGSDDTKDSDVDATGLSPALDLTSGDVTGLGAGLMALPSSFDISVEKMEPFITSGSASYDVAVANGGSALATFEIGLWLFRPPTGPPPPVSPPPEPPPPDSPPPGGGPPSSCENPDGGAKITVTLPPGETLSFTIESSLPEGSYTSILMVDSKCQVTETNETNNVKIAGFIIPSPAPVSGVTWWGLIAMAGLVGAALVWRLRRARSRKVT